MTATIKVGFDLDGVLARHCLDYFWFKIRKQKESGLIANGGMSHFYPKNRWEKLVLKTINYLRRISFSDKNKIKTWSNLGDFQLFLITARFSFLKQLTLDWLECNNLTNLFSQIVINKEDQDPIQFKSLAINTEGLDVFIDDDLEVLEKLAVSTKAKLFWLIPGWRQKAENKRKDIVVISSIEEALKKLTQTPIA